VARSGVTFVGGVGKAGPAGAADAFDAAAAVDAAGTPGPNAASGAAGDAWARHSEVINPNRRAKIDGLVIFRDQFGLTEIRVLGAGNVDFIGLRLLSLRLLPAWQSVVHEELVCLTIKKAATPAAALPCGISRRDHSVRRIFAGSDNVESEF